MSSNFYPSSAAVNNHGSSSSTHPLAVSNPNSIPNSMPNPETSSNPSHSQNSTGAHTPTNSHASSQSQVGVLNPAIYNQNGISLNNLTYKSHKINSSANSSSDMSLYSYPEMRLAEEWIKLNVGGQLMISTRTTLTKYANENNHFLAALVNNHVDMNSYKDPATDAYLIDRSPQYFKYVIDFLRTGRIDVENELAYEGILAEAEFCNLVAMIKLLTSMIERRDRIKQKSEKILEGKSGKKLVYWRWVLPDFFLFSFTESFRN